MEPTRKRIWLALGAGLSITFFSYIAYAGAFSSTEEGSDSIEVDLGLVGLALAIAPLGFAATAWISRHPHPGQSVLRATGLLVLVGLTLGLLSPILGVAAGLGSGIALTLRPPGEDGYLRRRIVGVALALVYMFAMLVFIPTAGVLAGAILPGLMVGFADEYGAWRAATARPV